MDTDKPPIFRRPSNFTILANCQRQFRSASPDHHATQKSAIVALSYRERPLGIPTIRDRVVQTATKLVLEPIFDSDFEDSAYGYRPIRGAVDAVKEVHRLICRGYTDVVDADLSRYLDPVSYCPLVHEAPSNSSL